MAKSVKLHEIIAVEPERKKESQAVSKRVKDTFNSAGKFIGYRKTYTPFEEQGEKFQPEVQVVSTTVGEEFAAVLLPWVDWLDVCVQKEDANMVAKATVELNGNAFLPELPVGALLNLEGKLAELKTVIEAIPTLDPNEEWHTDPNDKKGIYVTDSKETPRTVKKEKVVQLAPATDKHPAQAQLFSEDVRVGTWSYVKRSGAMSVSDKNILLLRVNELMREVKAARQRANTVEIDTSLRIGDKIAKYLTS